MAEVVMLWVAGLLCGLSLGVLISDLFEKEKK